jgi:hypothetical protein
MGQSHQSRWDQPELIVLHLLIGQVECYDRTLSPGGIHRYQGAGLPQVLARQSWSCLCAGRSVDHHRRPGRYLDLSSRQNGERASSRIYLPVGGSCQSHHAASLFRSAARRQCLHGRGRARPRGHLAERNEFFSPVKSKQRSFWSRVAANATIGWMKRK